MAGSNDLNINNIDSIQNIKDILLVIRELSPETSLAVTSIPIRRDILNSGQKVADFNNELKTFAHQSGCDLINTGKIDGTCLGQGKLHLNTKGNKTLASIYIDYCKNLWFNDSINIICEELAISPKNNTYDSSSISGNLNMEQTSTTTYESNISCFEKIKALKLKYPNNPTQANLPTCQLANKPT